MEHTPRRLFAMIKEGLRDPVLRSNAPWFCVSYYFCTVRCPQQIHITYVMYTLKGMAIKARLYRDQSPPDFSKTFVDYVEHYGRIFELGLASRYYLFNKPLAMLRMGPLGLSMFTRGRMALTPKRIKNLDQLQATILKARELGGVK